MGTAIARNVRDPIPHALETDWLVEVAGFEHLHQEICIPLASMLSAGRASTAAASAQDLLPLFGSHDSGKPNRACFLMRKVESCRPSVSNASHMKVAQKPCGTARFRKYDPASVCGIWQWRRHSCLLSPRAFLGISFLIFSRYSCGTGFGAQCQEETLRLPSTALISAVGFLANALQGHAPFARTGNVACKHNNAVGQEH
jgi:hypothetical protein